MIHIENFDLKLLFDFISKNKTYVFSILLLFCGTAIWMGYIKPKIEPSKKTELKVILMNNSEDSESLTKEVSPSSN